MLGVGRGPAGRTLCADKEIRVVQPRDRAAVIRAQPATMLPRAGRGSAGGDVHTLRGHRDERRHRTGLRHVDCVATRSPTTVDPARFAMRSSVATRYQAGLIFQPGARREAHPVAAHLRARSARNARIGPGWGPAAELARPVITPSPRRGPATRPTSAVRTPLSWPPGPPRASDP